MPTATGINPSVGTHLRQGERSRLPADAGMLFNGSLPRVYIHGASRGLRFLLCLRLVMYRTQGLQVIMVITVCAMVSVRRFPSASQPGPR